MSDTNDDWASRTINELRAENERLRATPEMAGHTWCKLERALAAEAKIAKLEKALELQKRIEGGFSGALMAAEQRLDAAAELVKKTDPWQPLGTIHDKLLALIDQAAPLADDEWKELDPERTHDRDDCDNPDCGTCMFNAADEWKELDPER